MHARGLSVAALLWLALPAHADHGPVVVVPGKPGVPVLRYGIDISGTVVHGDWGLYRPGHGRVLIEGPLYYHYPAYRAPAGYFPYTGMMPRYGRHEVDVRRPPRPAPSFHRQWSIESDPKSPATEYPPYEPPAVTIEPRRHWRR